MGKVDELAKSHKFDGSVKSTRCKGLESLGMKCAYKHTGMTNDEAQRRRGTFYKAVKVLLDM